MFNWVKTNTFCSQHHMSKMLRFRDTAFLEVPISQVKLAPLARCRSLRFARNNARYRSQVHINAVHRKIRPYKCRHCAFSAARTETVTRHTATVHDGFKFVCTACEFSSASRCSFFLFIIIFFLIFIVFLF